MLPKRWKMTALLCGKLCLSYVPVISEKMFASYVFPDKNQNPLRMCRMRITKQAVAIFSLISGNDILSFKAVTQ